MLEYDKDSGLFRHVPPCSNSARRDWHAGSTEGNGRLSVWFNGKNQRAHRVAWFLAYGEWPTNTVYHINGDPRDNRLCNLRCVSQQTNNRNLHKARKHNVVGVLGVTKFRNGYRARITVDGVVVHLGVFKSLDEATSIYKKAKLNYHGDTL